MEDNNDFFDVECDINDTNESKEIGSITEKEKLLAAKQILLGLGIITVICLIIYAIRPDQGEVLLEICKTSVPPLATLIIAFYFKEKCN